MYLQLYLHLYLCLCLTVCVLVYLVHISLMHASRQLQLERGSGGNLKLNLKVADEVVVLHHKWQVKVMRNCGEMSEKLRRIIH